MKATRTAKARQAVSAQERLLEAATELFCRYGINAVGVDEVVARAGAAKATLYKTFGSKERLVEAVLEREGDAWRSWFFARIAASGATPQARLAAVFPVLREWFADKRFYGCPFINAVAESDKASSRVRKLALAHKKIVLAFIEDLCREAKVRDPAAATHEIALLIDGATVTAMVTRDPGVARMAEIAARDLIGARLVAGAGGVQPAVPL